MTGQLNPAMSKAVNGELKGDFRAVRESAEDMVRATAEYGGERLSALRARANDAVKTVRSRVSDAQSAVSERVCADARATNAYVRENPWKSVGIAAGAGVLVGVLLARR